jgi:DNA-binding MarR family transcriptional regulator
MDKVTVNRAAKALADRQLIARQAHEADGRSHHLELTAAGRSLYDAIVPAALASEAKLEAALDAGERAALMAILAKLTSAAEDYGG